MNGGIKHEERKDRDRGGTEEAGRIEKGHNRDRGIEEG